MNENELEKVKVGDIMHLIINNPAVVKEDSLIKEILDKIIEDPRSRHVYIVDDLNKLIGSIRLSTIIEYLFPVTLFYSKATSLNNSNILSGISLLGKSGKNKAKEIMNKKVKYVFEETLLSDMIIIMTEENINELPVVDHEMKLIGEVNILEIIFYLKKQEEEESI